MTAEDRKRERLERAVRMAMAHRKLEGRELAIRRAAKVHKVSVMELGRAVWEAEKAARGQWKRS